MNTDHGLTPANRNPAFYPPLGPSDEVLAGSAEYALLCNDGADFRHIAVDAVDGVLLLLGKVRTESEKQEAAAAVRELDGVLEVHNLLEVAPELLTS